MTEEQLLLTIVSEECNETGQRASKAIRFGLQEVQAGQTLNNAERLLYEFNDLVAVMEILFDTRIEKLLDPAMINQKKDKVEEYMELSRELKVI